MPIVCALALRARVARSFSDGYRVLVAGASRDSRRARVGGARRRLSPDSVEDAGRQIRGIRRARGAVDEHSAMVTSSGELSRAEAEALIVEHGGDAAKVSAFLASVRTLARVGSRHGHPSPQDLMRYLRHYAYVEADALKLVESIWKLCNPKPPKPKEKRGVPPLHWAAECGYPSQARHRRPP